MADGDAYTAFLEGKVELAHADGLVLDDLKPHPWLKPHAAKAVEWMLEGGRRAVFASFGLHKTSMQLDACRLALEVLRRRRPGSASAAGAAALAGMTGSTEAAAQPVRGLIVVPLGVRQEFFRDAEKLGITLRFVQTTGECFEAGLYLTNYESVREGKIDLSGFQVVSLDEAACLRGMGGTKTFRVVGEALAAVPYRFVATATPSPNEYIELLAYAEVLGIMDIGQAKTRFFKRNSEKADALTLHPGREREFWLWVASWALFITKPSDLGCSDEGYDLPQMRVTWHEVKTPPAWEDDAAGGGQGTLFREASISVATQAREKRTTLFARIAKLAEIIAADPDAHRVLWHDLNAERDLIAQAVPEAFILDGDLAARDPEAAEAMILGFSDGFLKVLAAKPVMAGAGCNFQRHCRKAIFAGIGFKFHDFIQAVHRIHRFGQTGVVEIDVIYAESERGVRAELERKWAQHNQMVRTMGEIVRQYGLSSAAMADVLKRGMGVERVEAFGGPVEGRNNNEPKWRIVNNDCVRELERMPDNSVDLIVSSIPFSNLYEYSPNYADLGHNPDNAAFWRQMDFLIPHLLRVLKPGRDACIHVKDRILYGKVTGLGFETLEPFSDECRAAFRRHGFAYLGTITSITDVVRENNQTYRLSHSVQLRDGTRMGVGVPEQVILLRKPTSDPSNGFADEPVVKPRPAYADRQGRPVDYDREREKGQGDIFPQPGTGYSRGRWQLDAHSFWRSDGNRLLRPEEWVTDMNLGEAEKLWKAFALDAVYDFESHVLIGEKFEATGNLPSKFFLLPPLSWSASVWTDVLQMRSLNTEAFRKGTEAHICPLPFDIVNRLIAQRSAPGELVFDPFAGIGTVPYCALKLGRRGLGVELAPHYFAEAAKNCAIAEESSRPVPTLFDALEAGTFEDAGEVAA